MLEYSHRLKAHMHYVCPILTRHNTAKDKKYELDQALGMCKKIFLRKMNKTGLHDNYMGLFNVVSCSAKYFTVWLQNRKIDNLTVERIKPFFSESDALPRPAREEHHEVTLQTGWIFSMCRPETCPSTATGTIQDALRSHRQEAQSLHVSNKKRWWILLSKYSRERQ